MSFPLYRKGFLRQKVFEPKFVDVRLNKASKNTFPIQLLPQLSGYSQPHLQNQSRNSPNPSALLVLPELKEHTEIEVPFFTKISELTRNLKLSHLDSQHIFQSYIPEKNINEVLKLVNLKMLLERSIDESMLSRARIRRISSLHSDSRINDKFFLQMKSSKAGGVTRTEMGIEITASRYLKIFPFASAGSIQKIRYIKPGSVRSIKGKKFKAESHIDILLSAGKNTKLKIKDSNESTNFSYAFIDIEIPSAQLIPLVSEPTRHSFEFLSFATSILDHEKWIRRATASRYIAANGLKDPTFLKAIKVLSRSIEI